MPNIILPLNNLQASVERPVIYSVLRHVMNATRISSKTRISFHGDENAPRQAGSTLDDSVQGVGEKGALNASGVGENIWPFSDKVSVEISEDFDPTHTLTQPVKRMEHRPTFWDTALGVVVKPVYAFTNVEIRVVYRSADKNQADKWRNDIRQRTADQRDGNLHLLQYHYEFPEEYMVILDEIHRLREKQAGYGETNQDWFLDRLTERASVAKNLNGRKGVLVIAEPQGRVVGLYDFRGVPEKVERVGESSAWQASFTYKFSYEKPTHMAMRYPLLIHNQLLSTRFRPKESISNPINTPKNHTFSGASVSILETEHRKLLTTGNQGLRIPSFDEFVPSITMASTVPVFTAMVGITPEDKRSLINLKDLGDNVFQPDVLEFLKVEAPYLGTLYKSIITLDLYCNGRLQERDSVKVDADLNVVAAKDLDLRKVYHLRMGLVVEFKLLRNNAMSRLKNRFPTNAKLAQAIDGALVDKGGVRDIRKNKLRPEDYIEMGLKPDGSYQPLNPTDTTGVWPGTSWNPNWPDGYDPNEIKTRTVMVLFVATRRMENYPDNDRRYTQSDRPIVT